MRRRSPAAICRDVRANWSRTRQVYQLDSRQNSTVGWARVLRSWSAGEPGPRTTVWHAGLPGPGVSSPGCGSMIMICAGACPAPGGGCQGHTKWIHWVTSLVTVVGQHWRSLVWAELRPAGGPGARYGRCQALNGLQTRASSYHRDGHWRSPWPWRCGCHDSYRGSGSPSRSPGCWRAYRWSVLQHDCCLCRLPVLQWYLPE